MTVLQDSAFLNWISLDLSYQVEDLRTRILNLITFSAISSADGNYEVTIMTKALLNYTGIVRWKPPAIYKSYW